MRRKRCHSDLSGYGQKGEKRSSGRGKLGILGWDRRVEIEVLRWDEQNMWSRLRYGDRAHGNAVREDLSEGHESDYRSDS